MAFTNSTPNYGLPQYIGTDKPSWLVDINQAMCDIDTGMHDAKTQAATAEQKADDVTNAVTGALVYTGDHTINVPADGVKTASQLLADLNSAFTTYIASKGTNYRYIAVSIAIPYSMIGYAQEVKLRKASDVVEIEASRVMPTGKIVTCVMRSATTPVLQYDLTSSVFTDISNNITPIGNNVSITLQEFNLIA